MQARASGYAGPIELLFTLRLQTARVERLRVVRHQETPGIADFLDRPGAGWIESLENLSADGLADHDTVSGATVTSRAIVDRLGAALAAVASGEVVCTR
jgi:electron transport complex protein RnfG